MNRPPLLVPPSIWVQDIGHGIHLLSSQEAFESKTFGCYFDKKGGFHYGYFYLNGSNTRVAVWEDGQKVNRTVPCGAPMCLFADVVTRYPITSPKFSAEDFIFPWFDAAKERLQNELKAQEFHNFTSQMARLSMK